MAEPTISACVAVYNGADLLPRALRSMLEQTRKPDEILVLDDGSSDDSADVAASFPGVRVIRQANTGIGGARKRLVEEARYEWIAFNDHDDWWATEKLERLAPYTADPAVSLIYSLAFFVDQNGVITEPDHVPPDAPKLRHLLPNSMNIQCAATLFRRQTMLDIGNYRTELRVGEDTLAYFMLMARGKVVQVPERLAYHFERSGSTSAPKRSAYEYERSLYVDHLLPMWDALFGDLPGSEQAEAKDLIRVKVAHLDSIIGAWHDWEGNHSEAIRSYRRSFKGQPGSKGNLYRYFRSLMHLKVRPPGA